MSREVVNAIVTDADLVVDGGSLTVVMTFESSKGAQVLRLNLRKYDAGAFIQRVIETTGRFRWGDVCDSYVRIDVCRGIVLGIGAIIRDDWAYFWEIQEEGNE